MPSNFLVWDRLRLFAKQYNIYPSERIFQNQPQLDRLAGGTDLLGNDLTSIVDQTNLQINRLERYKDYEQMDQCGEISLALDLYADEGCVAAHTTIPLLDGTHPTVAELAARGLDHEFWVYAVDQKTGKYVPAKARAARITKRNAKVLRVTFDDGSYIRCTHNHLFMLRDNSFCRADMLKSGDSLKPLYKKRRFRPKNGHGLFDAPQTSNDSEYDFLFDPALNRFRSVHRWVYSAFHEDNPEIVHHADFRGTNNIPDNLHGMTNAEHDVIHRKYGRDNHSFKPVTLEQLRTAAAAIVGPVDKDGLGAIVGAGERVINRVLAESGLTWTAFKAEFNRCVCGQAIAPSKRHCAECRKEYCAAYHQSRKAQTDYRDRRKYNKRRQYSIHEAVKTKTCSSCDMVLDIGEFKRNGCAYSPYCNSCRPESVQKRYLAKSFANHKVVSVVEDGIEDAVYDIEVPGYHCFAAGTPDSWVIIHNSLVDPERKHTLVIRAKNKRIKQALEELYYHILQWDNYCRPTVRYLCKYGDFPAEVVTNVDRTGVASLRFMNVYNFTRVETRYGDLVGFFYQDEYNIRPRFLHPWQCMHLRLTSFENLYHPYGKAIIDGGRKASKQLRLMEDAALIYRITRAPEKRKYIVPIGNVTSKEIPEYMQALARQFKRQRFYNPATGTFDERYSPLIQEEDIFLPRRPDGTGPDIDILPGAENLDQIADIEYFKKKMIAPTKIPFARVGLGEGAGQANEKSLSQSHSEFAKSVQWVQREVANGLKKVGIIHLALLGFSASDIKGFDVSLTSTSAMEELYRIETWQTRAAVMAELKDLGWFPKEWIVTHFTDLSPDEIEDLKDMESSQGGSSGAGLPGGGGGGLDLPPPPGEGLDTETDIPGGDGGKLAGEPEDEEDPENLAQQVEGFDKQAARRLITEMREADSTERRRAVLNKLATAMNRPLVSDSDELDSGFDGLLHSGELDGLTRETIDGEVKVNDSNLLVEFPEDEKCLIGYKTEPADRMEVITETYAVVCDVEETVAEPEDISPSDLPG